MSFSGKTTVIFISCSFALLRSKQPEFLKQEIYSRLILYNFGIFIANEAAEENRKKKRDGSNKYLYKLDFSSALKTARKFFMRRDSGRHIDIIRLMMKYVHAVKDRFRPFQRPLRGISAIHFGYLQLNILLFGRWTASVFLAYLFLAFWVQNIGYLPTTELSNKTSNNWLNGIAFYWPLLFISFIILWIFSAPSISFKVMVSMSSLQ